MKKIICLFLAIFLFFVGNSAFSQVKKEKCNKPIYYFEDANKSALFNALDALAQKKKWKVVKYQPELGFLSFTYKVKKEPETVSIDMKQTSRDVYLFMDISKGNTDLEKEIYNKLKPLAKKSNLIQDEVMCKEFLGDVASVTSNRKTTMKEVPKEDDVYRIGLNRYVGYEHKIYFKDRWDNFRAKAREKKLWTVKGQQKASVKAAKQKKEDTVQMQLDWLKEQRVVKKEKYKQQLEMQKEWLKEQRRIKQEKQNQIKMQQDWLKQQREIKKQQKYNNL